MSANSSLILSNLDFDTLKNTFKAYLKSQDRFRDYDFEGSNMSVLLDVLAYNTFHNSFYLNMVGNEMFLDSAQLRDSVVSHAKELNYTPRSFTSARATVALRIRSTNTAKRSLIIPKGYSFTSRLLNKSYTFSVPVTTVVDQFVVRGPNEIEFQLDNLDVFEGFYVNESYTYTGGQPPRMMLTNKNVDLSSISVTVIEDAGSTVLNYMRAQSLFDLDRNSEVFFVQGAENETYEIMFGDGVTGRRPKTNSVINIEYRLSNGQLPNGCNVFTPDTPIQGETNITVSTVAVAAGGNISESIESIRFNAPRHFTAQERAVTTEDYETLLTINFPEINAVTAYGGEDLDPPQFGKVFVSVDLKDVDALPDIKRREYLRFLRPRSPVSIDPVFVEPEYTYLGVNSKINYNINITSLTQDDIRTIAGTAMQQFSETTLNNFNRTFRYSRFIQAIDDSQLSIVSNETQITVIKLVTPLTGEFLTFDVEFGVPLSVIQSTVEDGVSFAVSTTPFVYKGFRAFLRDDGNGIINVLSTATEAVIDTVGTVDYQTGRVQLANFRVDGLIGPNIKFIATPLNKDISTTNNVILNILEEDIVIDVNPIRV